MRSTFFWILRSFGVTRAIGFGVLSRLWSIPAGLLTIYLIGTRFSKHEQGFFYTFYSLLSLQVFFELGLLNVLSQFASHEFFFLKWGKRGEVDGDDAHRDQFLDLLAKGVKWYSVSAVLLSAFLIPLGWHFFSQKHSSFIEVNWRFPWVLSVIGVSLNLLLIPFFAVINGSGEVALVNKREMFGGMIGSTLGWITILLGFGLYAIPATTAGSFFVGAVFLLKKKPALVYQALCSSIAKEHSGHSIPWWEEVWPMQWKMAVSWISGFFIFQLFTPALFHFHGPVVAGQMGMTLSAVNSVQGICLMWLNSKSPEFGRLIVAKNWRALDRSLDTTLRQALTVCLLFSTGAVATIAGLQRLSPLGARFLSLGEILLFLGAVFCNVVISGWAIYMRAHKVEPLLPLSVLSAILIGASTLILGNFYASLGMAAGYFLILCCYGIPATYSCLKKFRLHHHSQCSLSAMPGFLEGQTATISSRDGDG